MRSTGTKIISLEGHEVCLMAWSIIYSILKADFYWFKRYSTSGMRASHHGNWSTKKNQVATQQACASLLIMIEGIADFMLYNFCTLPNGERVVERVLFFGTKWIDVQHHINEFISYLLYIVFILTV
jgi:hypothetical protein